MRRFLPLLLVLGLAVSAQAMEAYRSTAPEVYRAQEIEVHRVGEVPSYKSREVEVYKAKPTAGKSAPTGATGHKQVSLVKAVEGAAAVAARSQFCSLPDRGIREKLLEFLSASGRSPHDTASYLSIFDAARTAALEKARLSRKGKQSLCSPEILGKVNSATERILTALAKRSHGHLVSEEANPERSAGKEVPSVGRAGEVKLFTKQDLERMHQNDVKAGRTRESIHTGLADKKMTSPGKRGAATTYNPDPYNTGGWNYNTNQPSSPIWSPFNQ